MQMKHIALALSAAFAMISAAQACTTVIAGEGATADGSFLIARSADSSAMKAQHIVKHPARDYRKGAMYRTQDYKGATDFSYPQPEHAMAYTTVPNWKTQLHGATGFNEAGVGISGTESIFARDDALKLDPYNEKTGITEDDILDVLLPRAKTAKEAVAELGKIIETIGAGEGFGVVFVDDKDVWYLETGTGHQWMAQRTPKDMYFATGNQGRLTKIDPKSDQFMGSPTLIDWAQKNGFYDPKKDGEFNFAKAYTRDDGRDRVYNDPRVWNIMKTLTPSFDMGVDSGRDFPVYQKAAKKITVEDMKAAMRDHFQTGKLTDHDPYTKGLRGDEPYRPVSVFRTYESHVMQVRPWLPEGISRLTYLAMGMADLSVYVPLYQGFDNYPKSFGMGTDKADSESTYWKYRKLQTLVMTDYPKLHGVVQKAYADWEKQTAADMKTFEAEYAKVYKTDKQKADQMLEKFNLDVVNSAEALTEKLTNEVFTIRTKDIEDANFFANNKAKD